MLNNRFSFIGLPPLLGKGRGTTGDLLRPGRCAL